MRKQLLSPMAFTGIIAILVLSIVQVSAAPGDLDTTFGIAGQLQDTTMRQIRGTIVQPDGKIIVAGSKWLTSGAYSFEVPAVARYNSDGSLDYTFGTEGSTIASTDVANSGKFYGVVLQSDGKVVAAGSRGTSSFIVRLNTDGTFDTTFSGDGKRSFTFAAVNYERSFLSTVALVQSTGDIVVAGSVLNVYDPDPYANRSDITIARLNTDGTFDTAFGSAGKQTLHVAYDTNDDPTSIAIHPTSRKIALSLRDDSFFKVAMVNENGGFDASFDGNGVATTDFGGVGSLAESIAFQRIIVSVGGYPAITYRLVAGGWSYLNSTTKWDFALARYKTDGTLDTSFNTDGKVRKALSYDLDMIKSVRIDSAGRIVTAGPRRWNSFTDFAIVRFTQNGDYDTSFGNQGKVYTQFFVSGTHVDAPAYTLALAPDGKLVVASGEFSSHNKFLARYQP